MSPSFDIWKMLAGVAFFLLAMNFMEDSLRRLAGRRFKLFLKKQTKNKVKAIGTGAIITGLLQSSSIVNLLVLSMVGASVVKMDGALAIMLGSNLGTTLNSWIIATLGFNFNIENFVLPVAGITGICMAFINSESKWFQWFRFLFSLAFLFVALGFIKSGMEEFVKQTDLSAFNQYPSIIFLLLGILLTTIVQSSSATIALTLSALYTNAITLYVATAIALGSEIGTTFKLFLASAKGLTAKKRVALGNFLFNLVTVIILFLLLRPVNFLITDVLQIKSNLIALVFFQTFVNLVSIILFFPFLKLFGQFLMKRFVDKDDESIYISKVPVTDSELALEALENETNLFINQVIDYSLDSFDLEEIMDINPAVQKEFLRKTVAEKYDHIKQSHGEMHAFCLKLQNAGLDKTEIERLQQLMAAIRNTMYAAKNIRDAQ
ncbi:MAG TPA: Na/Pi symporter, partial [Chitinophagaceae bacterium]